MEEVEMEKVEVEKAEEKACGGELRGGWCCDR